MTATKEHMTTYRPGPWARAILCLGLFMGTTLMGQSATVTGGNVVGGFWNSTNTGMTVSFNTPNDDNYNNGYAQIHRIIGTDTSIIHVKNPIFGNTPHNVGLTAGEVETAGGGFGEDSTMRFIIKYYKFDNALLAVEAASGTFLIDQTIPSAPAKPNMYSASDLGQSSIDDITSDNTPSFFIDGVTTGDFIMLLFGDSEVDSASATGANIDLTPGFSQSDNDYDVTATATDDAGNESVRSVLLPITIDTMPPSPPAAPDLNPASDSGDDDTDNNTNDKTPTFTVGNVSAGYTVELIFGVSPVASGNATGTSISLTPGSDQGDGIYAVTAIATDVAGNESGPSGDLSLTIDTVKPDAPSAPDLASASDSGPSNTDDITSDTTPSFDIAGVTDGNKVTLYFTGVSAATGTAPGITISLTASSQGDNTYYVTASQTDAAGNESLLSTPALEVKIDAAAPGQPNTPDLQDASDSGRSNGDDITNDDTPTFDVGGVTAGDVVTIRYGGTPRGSVTAASATATITADSQPSGDYDVTAVATDVAGNVSTASSALSISIDTQTPSPPAQPDLQSGSDTGLSGTDNNTADTTPTFDISGVAATDSVIVLAGGVFKGSAIAAGTSVAVTTAALTPGDPVTITAKSVDVAGNQSNASVGLDITLDTTPPSPPAQPDLLTADDSGSSSSDDTTSVTTPTITIGGVTSGHRVTLYFSVTAVDSGIASGTTIDLAPSLAQNDGSHSVTAVATDPAGNPSSASAALTIVIDTQAPTAPGAPDMQPGSDSGNLATDNITNDNTPTFDVSGVSVSDRIDLNFDGVTVANEIATSGTVVLTPSGTISDATYTVTANATDVAGNTSAASTSLAVTIDIAPPATPGTPDLEAASDNGTLDNDNITNDVTPAITVSAVTSGDSISVRFNGVEKAKGIAASASITVTSSSVIESIYSVTATATDQAGNTSAISGVLSLTIDTTPPDTPIIPDLLSGSDSGISSTDNITNDDTPTFQITDGNGLELNNVISLKFNGAVVATGTATGATLDLTPSAQSDGNYNVMALASDVAGNPSGLSPVLTLTIDLTAPTVALTYSDTLVKEADPIALTATFSEAAAATPTVDIDYAGTGSDISSDPLTLGANDSLWTYTTTAPADNDGPVTVSITGTDLAGNNATVASGATTLEMDNTVPVFTAVAPLDSSYENTTKVSYTLSENLASGTITWDRTGGTADPGVPHSQALTGTELDAGVHTNITLTNDPPLVSGSVYTVTFSGEDEAGNTATDIILTNVTFDNIVPTAALTYSDTLASLGDTVAITVTFNEPAASTPQVGIVYAVNTLPATNMDSTSTTVWTYDAIIPDGNDGPATVTITATDLAGNALTIVNTTDRTDLVVDNTPPGYVLAYSDSLVKKDDVVTITATFEESAKPTPTHTIDFAGTGADTSGAAMSLTATDSVWTYNLITPAGNDGFVTVTISATDLAGNQVVPISGSTNTLKVDNIPPILAITAPDSASYVSSTALSYTLGEDLFSGQLIWTWEGNAGVTDNASPHIEPLVGTEPDAGSHTGILTNAPPLVQAAAYTIQLMGVDGAGNADTFAVANVTYDTLAPGSSGATVYDGDSLLFDFDSTQAASMILANFSGFSDATSGIVLYEYAIGSAAGGTDVLAWTANGTDTSFTAGGLQLAYKQYYFVMVRATDGAGNVSDSVSSDGVRIIAKPRLTTSVIQNSALWHYVQIFVNDTLGMANSIRVVVADSVITHTTIDSTTYVTNYQITEEGTLLLEVTGFSASGDTTLSDSVTIALAKQAQPWVAASADQRFRVAGQPGAVNEDRYFLVVDSTLFVPSENSGGAYRIGDGQFSFAAPVRVSMRPGPSGLAKGTAKQAIYFLGPDGRWEELPTVDSEAFVTTWASQTGVFRLGRRTIMVPQTTSLHQNYPNPFNPVTRIVFDLGFLDGPRQQSTVEIYDLLGRHVITLFDGEASAGHYEMVWGGTDARGLHVASGVYFVRLVTQSGYHVTKKMLLVR